MEAEVHPPVEDQGHDVQPPCCVLITGASRGIGLELASQYAADGWRVLATCRDPAGANALLEVRERYPRRLFVHALDVAEEAQIEELGRHLREDALDVLINNAGWALRQRTLAETTLAAMERAMRVNAFATLKMSQVFAPHVARSRKKTIVTISSQMGSITENDGLRYGYRASKAAANMIVKTLALELAGHGIVVASLHPGWVRTDFGGADAPLSAHESALRVRELIAALTPAKSGGFFAQDGREIPW
jgi:NAD(P)-dependent dehydrogenase (short-subunit alcohol dehydrogenase family)